MEETNESSLINSKAEFYVKKNKTIYTLPNGSKLIYEVYPNPDENDMIFSETPEIS